MKRQLTEHQQRCVQTVLAHMKEYLDLRFHLSIRANPRFESPWPDLQFLLLAQLRNTLENDKMWGPTRYVIGEVLCETDRGKVRDIFSPVHQSSIQSEVVERTDKAGQKTSDLLEIHDFKTLYSAMDPAVANIASVIQIYMWWDLPDAGDLARFYIRYARFHEMQKGINEQWQQYYHKVIHRTTAEGPDGHLPSQEEILDFEAGQLRDAMGCFCDRRVAEPGYKMILARRDTATESAADMLISTIAREIVLLHKVEREEALEDSIRQHIAAALGTAPDQLRKETMVRYLRNALADGKRRLMTALHDSAGGEVYNYKASQADAMRRVYIETVGEERHERLVRKEEEDRQAMRSMSQEAVPRL